MKNNLFIHDYNEFKTCILENLKIDNKGVVLEKDTYYGKLISNEYSTKEFISLISSWNVLLEENDSISLSYSVFNGEVWSSFLNYGKWSLMNNYSNSNNEDKVAIIDIDNILLKDSNIGLAFKYLVEFKKENINGIGPILKRVNTTIKPSNIYKKENINLNKIIDVPLRSQLDIPEIGNQICSPTSVAMVMDYNGVNISTSKCSDLVFDNGASIYGNWSYNASLPGQYNLYSYVEVLEDINDIKEYITNDIPVIASIRTNNKDELQGTIMAYPHGHLLVVVGFTKEEGKDYVIVNDPAEYITSKVLRKYLLNEFIKAWRGVVYVIRGELDDNTK